MRPVLLASEYYDGSATTRCPQRALRLPADRLPADRLPADRLAAGR